MEDLTQSSRSFGRLSSGEEITRFELSNSFISVGFLDYGVRLQSLLVNRPKYRPQQTVLGFDSIAEYEQDSSYIGAVVGRYANRISAGRCQLNGSVLQLDQNDGNNHLHGGFHGFDSRLWQTSTTAQGLIFRLTSQDGEGGYPGELSVKVMITLRDKVLRYEYEARCEVDTYINLTNHAYFNLLGPDANILDHQLTLDSDRYLPVDSELLPTGELRHVANTRFAFRRGQVLGEHLIEGDLAVKSLDVNKQDNKTLEGTDPQLTIAGGFDHCFVLGESQQMLLTAAGIGLRIKTSEPAVQLYTGNQLERRHSALCLETQHFPDSPNQSDFPSTLLRAGEIYKSFTEYEVGGV